MNPLSFTPYELGLIAGALGTSGMNKLPRDLQKKLHEPMLYPLAVEEDEFYNKPLTSGRMPLKPEDENESH